MERYLVLAKFYSVAEKLKKERMNSHKNSGEMQAEIARVSGSGRNILGRLLNNENINQRALSKLMNISAQAVSENLKKLEQGGYITRVDGAQNNENIIILTPSGREIAIELDWKIRNHAESVLANMDEEEIEILYKLLDKMLDK